MYGQDIRAFRFDSEGSFFTSCEKMSVFADKIPKDR